MSESGKNFAVILEEPDKGEVIDPIPPTVASKTEAEIADIEAKIYRKVKSVIDHKTCWLRGRSPEFAKGHVICYERVVDRDGRLIVRSPKRC